MKIFIGYDTRQDIAARVLEFSLKKHSSVPLDIRYLTLSTLDFNRPRDPHQTTEFSFTRFLVPYLCCYEGRAIFMDCDMLCLGDIAEIASLPMDEYALRVVKQSHVPVATTKMDGQPQSAYPRKNWSSLMLMDCAKLRVWSKRAVETMPGLDLHQFRGISDRAIGELPPNWNDLDYYDLTTKLLHYTSGGPWLPGCESHPYANLWLEYRDDYTRSCLPSD